MINSRSAMSRLKGSDNMITAAIDATDDSADWSFLPEEIHGMVYLGASINLKPFQRPIRQWRSAYSAMIQKKKQADNAIRSKGMARLLKIHLTPISPEYVSKAVIADD
jgi:hypothetical protein